MRSSLLIVPLTAISVPFHVHESDLPKSVSIYLASMPLIFTVSNFPFSKLDDDEQNQQNKVQGEKCCSDAE